MEERLAYDQGCDIKIVLLARNMLGDMMVFFLSIGGSDAELCCSVIHVEIDMSGRIILMPLNLGLIDS